MTWHYSCVGKSRDFLQVREDLRERTTSAFAGSTVQFLIGDRALVLIHISRTYRFGIGVRTEPAIINGRRSCLITV
jgi:hypothetical protein